MKSWLAMRGELSDYVDDNWLRDSLLKRRLREETARLPQAGMQISAHQGQQMALLARTSHRTACWRRASVARSTWP